MTGGGGVRIVQQAGGYILTADGLEFTCNTHADAIALRNQLIGEREAYVNGVDYETPCDVCHDIIRSPLD